MPPIDPTRDVENALFANGADWVIGVDEVGLGALAGPVTIAMCAIRPDTPPAPPGLRDSKALTARARTALAPVLDTWAPDYQLGYSTAPEIDAHGITAALQLAARRAWTALAARIHPTERTVLLLDGSNNWLAGLHLPQQVITRVKADRDCVCVAAASVLAKTARDTLLEQLHEQHPQYAWNSNKGYGSAAHRAGIAEYGPVPGLHRHTWLH